MDIVNVQTSPCCVCGQASLIPVVRSDFERWQGGELVQRALGRCGLRDNRRRVGGQSDNGDQDDGQAEQGRAMGHGLLPGGEVSTGPGGVKRPGDGCLA